MNQFSRRKFLHTVDVSAASTIFLKAGGNPPEPGSQATTEQVETADISPEQMPETGRFKSIYFKNTATPS
ncbi:hypothetical protein [Stanieria cyanosphaera]|uniref:hypothetical protein n=1 Tax=Stanieria cyanosphaera TaxID=102116 RepID=UPI0002FF270E|nr:hypothetical protein [Stanieria cyanosphaera]